MAQVRYCSGMRSIAVLSLLLGSFTATLAFDSKTWMHKGCKVHISVGAREASAIGSYLVTVAAPTGKRDTVRVDRDGALVGAWATDIDGDGKFEVIVATRSVAGGNYGRISIHSWTGSSLKPRTVPELSRNFLGGYRGQDQFSVARNNLYRSFPTFVQTGSGTPKKVGNRTLRLNLKKFRWEAV